MGTGVSSQKDVKTLKQLLAERESRIAELEGQLGNTHISEKDIKASTEADVRKMCIDLMAANKALKDKLAELSQERDNTVEQLQRKMELVMKEKDRQLKRQGALGETERPLANKTKDNKQIRMAISAETAKVVDTRKLPKIPKSKDDRNYLNKALQENQFFKSLKQDQINKIIDCMDKRKYKADVEIIKEGADGICLYVLESGAVVVSTAKDGEVATLEEGKVFGELALLYNCRRTASVRSKADCTVYQLDRKYFQAIVQSTGAELAEEKYNLLKIVPSLKDLPAPKLKKIADCLEEEHFTDGDCIIKQGTTGDLFYIISDGTVKITKSHPGKEEEVVDQREKGNFFGERALQSEEKRSANVYSVGDVKCFSLDRLAFQNLIGSIQEQQAQASTPKEAEVAEQEIPHDKSMDAIQLSEVRVLKALGQGGFGDVKLVYFKNSTVEQKPYALKCVQKCRIVQYGQQRHIMDEKNILFQMRSPFLLNLHKTFKDSKQVYLLTDAYLGGDLWRLLHARGPFPDTVARFYVACVVEAFAYLHARGIVYRDLKPENLMLDINGYLRLVDLGFAKRLPIGNKTWTFCGTPEYIPPEVIANTGHHLSADYWSLGILVYELLTRKTPFRAKDDLTIYENILRGIHSVQFSYRISRKAEMLIKALCRQEPSERLGYQKGGINDIRKHKWFGGFDWDGFHVQRVPAPILPDVRDPMENADKAQQLENMNHIPDETSGWDADF